MKKILFYFALLFFANHAYTQKKDDSVILKKIDKIDFKLEKISNSIDSFKIINKVKSDSISILLIKFNDFENSIKSKDSLIEKNKIEIDKKSLELQNRTLENAQFLKQQESIISTLQVEHYNFNPKILEILSSNSILLYSINNKDILYQFKNISSQIIEAKQYIDNNPFDLIQNDKFVQTLSNLKKDAEKYKQLKEDLKYYLSILNAYSTASNEVFKIIKETAGKQSLRFSELYRVEKINAQNYNYLKQEIDKAKKDLNYKGQGQ